MNAVTWQPFTSNLCTGSGDKTVSLWDARSGLCIQTFYGHLNACNHVAMSKRGDVVASCDADGVIKLWDVRTVSELATLETGYYPINQVSTPDTVGRLLSPVLTRPVRVFVVCRNARCPSTALGSAWPARATTGQSRSTTWSVSQSVSQATHRLCHPTEAVN